MSSLTFLGKIILAGIVLALVGIGFIYFSIKKARAPAPVACTMEAMQCPDGSWVGRTGPNCEFAACPTSTSTSATSTTPTATSTHSNSSWQATTTPGIR